MPIVGVVSDGQDSIRKAVKKALDGVPHQLCHFHYLREAAKPIYEADRHAKKELKKRVRGVRPIERKVEGRDDPEAKAIRGYCAAVRTALTDDGRPPLSAPGLVLQGAAGGGGRRASTGSRKKGAPDGTDPATVAALGGPVGDGGDVGAGARRPTTGCSGPRRSWRTWRA